MEKRVRQSQIVVGGSVKVPLILSTSVTSASFMVQVLALAFYVVSYFPGGAQGMQFMLGMVGRGVSTCIGSFTRASG